MRPNNPRVLIPVLLGLVLLIGASLLLTGGRPHSANPEDVRTQFNKDKGKVRLVMLLSPT